MSKKPESVRVAQGARRKAELAAGVRADRRFVEKIVPNTRRKKQNKHTQRELRKEV